MGQAKIRAKERDKKLWQSRVAEFALGTANTVDQIAGAFETTEDEVRNALIEFGVEECETCGWWCEEDELNDKGDCNDHWEDE